LICTDCAGFSQSFACSRCGYEDKLLRGRLCCRCTLADLVAEVLDDGSGRIRPELVPLAESLIAMNSPLSGLKWLRTDHRRARSARDLLRRLARGEIELTHEAFHVLQPWRAAAHIRELLMSCGILPPIDKRVCSLERWLAGYLASIADEGHAQVIQRFATWEVLSPPPRPRRAQAGHAVRPPLRRRADQARRRLPPVASDRGLSLASCSQADIGAWHAGNDPHVRATTRAFLQWCMASKLTRRLQLPPPATRHAAALPDHERIRHLGRVLAGHDLPLRPRVAAAILLLYAQPVSRIVRIATGDVVRDGGEVLLRIGDPPSPVPEPVAGLLLRWIDSRGNMNTATNRNSPWLFPGRRADQPMNADSLSAQVNGIGVPTIGGRTAAIRKHVLDMPSPVVADALGYHPATTARLASQAGSTFSRYAPKDHKRQTAGGGDS